MHKRPLSLTMLSLVCAAVGAGGFVAHLADLRSLHEFLTQGVWVEVVEVVAIVCGMYMLRGRNWARWLALGWMTFHVILSAFHSATEFLIHGVLLILVAYLLFRPQATSYFRSRRVAAA